ncbi:MAG: hypothetical protein HZA17_00235 [Nitrospirae bacterium]|nr:hypothetical protein [Nitrospirota bacterium]
MSPHIIIYGFLSFLGCMLIHVVVWRIKIPRHDALLLFFIFLIFPSIFFLLLGVVKSVPVSGTDAAYGFLLHVALSVVYISSYPAAQAISPSLDIMLVIGSSQDRRMTEEDIISRYDDGVLVAARVDDLRHSSLVLQKGGTFELTSVGKTVAGFFVLYRKLLGLHPGGG